MCKARPSRSTNPIESRGSASEPVTSFAWGAAIGSTVGGFLKHSPITRQQNRQFHAKSPREKKRRLNRTKQDWYRTATVKERQLSCQVAPSQSRFRTALLRILAALRELSVSSISSLLVTVRRISDKSGADGVRHGKVRLQHGQVAARIQSNRAGQPANRFRVLFGAQTLVQLSVFYWSRWEEYATTPARIVCDTEKSGFSTTKSASLPASMEPLRSATPHARAEASDEV